jgi:hypothetical protein
LFSPGGPMLRNLIAPVEPSSLLHCREGEVAD